MEVLHKLAIHEAYNSHKYGEVQVYEWDPIFITPLYIYFPEDKPAKKVTFKMKAGHAASNYEDNDILAILMKTSDSLYHIDSIPTHKQINVDVKNGLPFTIDGLMITAIKTAVILGYHAALDTSHDYIDIISYH